MMCSGIEIAQIATILRRNPAIYNPMTVNHWLLASKCCDVSNSLEKGAATSLSSPHI